MGVTACHRYGMFFVVRIVQPKFVHVIGLIVSILIIYYYNDKNIHTISNMNEELEYQLNTLRPKPEYFHHDANIIKFFYDIREFRKYNIFELHLWHFLAVDSQPMIDLAHHLDCILHFPLFGVIMLFFTLSIYSINSVVLLLIFFS